MTDQIRIVLVEPQNPINVGTVMRAMKNMGFRHLVLVHPAEMDMEKTQISAHHSEDFLASIQTVQTLDEALVGVHESYGFSARQRSETWASLDMEEAVSRAVSKGRDGCGIAYVFGREQSGLSNEELMRCSCRVHIVTGDYSSLNLAQAVLLAMYATRRESGMTSLGHVAPLDNHTPGSVPASLDAQRRLINHIENALVNIGYYKSPLKNTALHRIQNILQRASLHDDEIHLLMGICTEIVGYSRLVERGIAVEKICPEGSPLNTSEE